MSTTLLQDLIGKIKTDHAQAYEDAKAGKTPSSAYDGPPLPLNLEYRAVVDTATFGKSKNSGRDQFTLTYEIQEPVEYAGRKVQDYHSPAPTNAIGSEQLAKLFGALKANLDGWGGDGDLEPFIKQFEGRTLVMALRTWGEDEDRYGVRWVNPDYGQTLKTDVKPPKSKGGDSSLKADIQIPKPQTPETPAAPVVAPPEAPSEPAAAPAAVTPPPAVNLPPGLRG